MAQGIRSDIFLYTYVELLFKLTPVLTLPLLLQWLTPADFGWIEAAASLITAVTGLLTLGVGSALHKYYFEGIDRQSIFSAGLSLISISCALAFSCVVLVDCLGDVWSKGLGGGIYYLLSVYVVSLVFSQVALDFLRISGRAGTYLLVGFFVRVVSPVLSVVGVYFFDSVSGYFFGMFLGSFTGGVLALFFCWRYVAVGAVDLAHVRLIISYGWPLALMAPMQWCVSGFDKLFLAKEISFEVSGVYALSVKIALCLGMLFSAFLAAWGPIALRMKSESQGGFDLTNELFFYLAGAVVFLALLISKFFAGPVYVMLFSADYYQGAVYLPGLIFGCTIQLVIAVLYPYISVSGKSYIFLASSILGAVVGLALNYLLVPFYEGMGAVSAMIVSGFVVFSIGAWFCWRLGARFISCYDIIAVAFVSFSLISEAIWDNYGFSTISIIIVLMYFSCRAFLSAKKSRLLIGV